MFFVPQNRLAFAPVVAKGPALPYPLPGSLIANSLKINRRMTSEPRVPAAKAKGGRPKKKDEDKRSKAIQVRLEPASYAYVQELAQQRNTSMADVIRDLCVGDVTVINAEQEALLRQIATMSNNLNQLARKANTDGIRSVALLVDRRVRELGELLDRYAK